MDIFKRQTGAITAVLTLVGLTIVVIGVVAGSKLVEIGTRLFPRANEEPTLSVPVKVTINNPNPLYNIVVGFGPGQDNFIAQCFTVSADSSPKTGNCTGLIRGNRYVVGVVAYKTIGTRQPLAKDYEIVSIPSSGELETIVLDLTLSSTTETLTPTVTGIPTPSDFWTPTPTRIASPTPTTQSTPTPTVTPSPTLIPTSTPSSIPSPTPTPTCINPPPCVYRIPACLLSEPAGGWCPVTPTVVVSPTPTVEVIPTEPGTTTCKGNPARLTCFETWRQVFTGTTTNDDADMTGDGNVSLADFELWRRAYVGASPTGQ